MQRDIDIIKEPASTIEAPIALKEFGGVHLAADSKHMVPSATGIHPMHVAPPRTSDLKRIDGILTGFRNNEKQLQKQ